MKFSDWLIISLFYLIVGCLVGAPIDVFAVPGDSTAAEFVVLVLAWPVFAVKYISLGLWEIIQAFIYLIGL